MSRHSLTNGLESGVTWRNFDHTYTAARVDLRGRGSLGFEVHEVDDDTGDATTTTHFDNTTSVVVGQGTAYPFAALPSQITHVIINPFVWRYERTISREYTTGAGDVPDSFTVELETELDAGLERRFPDQSTDLHSRRRSFEYDDLGNVSKTTTEVPGSDRVVESS